MKNLNNRVLTSKALLFFGLPLMCLASQNASAKSLPNPKSYPVGPPTMNCVFQASQDHNVPFAMLLGLNSVERGKTGQYVGNTNGTKDIGAFQINTIHLKRARAMGANSDDLAQRGCYNAQFAAMLLKEALTQSSKQHLDMFTRGAGYHSWTPKYNNIYKDKLARYTSQWQQWLNRQSPTNNSNKTDYTNSNSVNPTPVSFSSENPFFNLGNIGSNSTTQTTKRYL